MDRLESLKKLADALEAVQRGEIQNREALRKALPATIHPDVEVVLCYVDHYLSDADIRARDVGYKQMQEAHLARLIALLRQGASLEELRECTFL